MGKYLKLFENHTSYDTFINGGGVELPNVSHCILENEVHYNPIVDFFSFKVLVTNASISTYIFGNTNFISEVYIDGVKQGSVTSAYQLSQGEHTFECVLTDKTIIGDDAIYGNIVVTEVTIPNGVEVIEDYAFSSCLQLVKVSLPNTLKTIENNAFEDCYLLSNIVIPNGVKTIEDRVFQHAHSLTSVTIPNSVTSLGEGVWCYDSGITNVIIGNGLTSIPYDTFDQCTSISNITIPSNINNIGQAAFYKCSSLVNVTLESTTPPTLNSTAFEDNASGRKFYVPSQSVEAYKAAVGWSIYANDILAIE